MAAYLADAEEQCQDCEGALRQILGEAEVQKIVQAHVEAEEAGTMRGQYLTTVTRVRMRDFSLNRGGGRQCMT